MSSDSAQSGMPIADAAKHLGVTVEMLRKRAQRGTLPAYKVDGRWFIIISESQDHVSVQDTTPVQDIPDRTYRTGQNPSAPVTPAAFSQLEAIRDQWLRPFVEELNAKSERIGRLEERLAAVESERDELRRQVEITPHLIPTPDETDIEHRARVRAYLEESRRVPDSYHDAEDASEAAEVAALAESNKAPSSPSRSVFTDLWRWLRGR